MKVKRLVLPGLLALAAYFGFFGGEYSYFEVRAARRAAAEEEEALAQRRLQIDSLQAWADSLEVDSATLERLARERFGMIREGEILYRFAETTADTTGVDTLSNPGR